MSPLTADAFVPDTALEVIASPPSVMSAQPLHWVPSARLKSSDADTVGFVVQVTATLVASAAAIVPRPARHAARLPSLGVDRANEFARALSMDPARLPNSEDLRHLGRL